MQPQELNLHRRDLELDTHLIDEGLAESGRGGPSLEFHWLLIFQR